MFSTTYSFGRAALGACALASLLGFSSGCATVTRGLNDSVRIESQPSGATVRLGNGRVVTTPTTVSLPRKHSMQVTFELAGYETTTAVLTPSRSKTGKVATSGNVLIGGLLGVGIDAGTGAVFDLFPNPLVVRLKAVRIEGAPTEWHRLRTQLARSEVRDILGDPVSIHGTKGDQEWTYADGGRVFFTNYFTVRWETPPASAGMAAATTVVKTEAAPAPAAVASENSAAAPAPAVSGAAPSGAHEPAASVPATAPAPVAGAETAGDAAPPSA